MLQRRTAHDREGKDLHSRISAVYLDRRKSQTAGAFASASKDLAFRTGRTFHLFQEIQYMATAILLRCIDIVANSNAAFLPGKLSCFRKEKGRR